MTLPATDPRHDPVLLAEVVAGLAPAPGEVMVDGTFGAGGYSRALLAAGATVYAFDRDPDAIAEGQPIVASQPLAYTLEQIDRWKSGKRRNDPRGVMAAAVQRLTDAEARAIAQWLSGQSVSPTPASASASASVSAAAAARPAASRETRRPDRSDGA